MSSSGMGDVEAGIPWDLRPNPVHTRHRLVWGLAAWLSCFSSFYFVRDLLDLLLDKLGPFENVVYILGFSLCVGLPGAIYVGFLMVIIVHRLPGPYKLRRSEKQRIDCGLLVFCSCWNLYFRDLKNTVILGPMVCFHVMLVLNIWWDYLNFGLCDCALAVLIEAALFSCRNNWVLLMAVAIVGVALQLLKSVYQEQYIKSHMEK